MKFTHPYRREDISAYFDNGTMVGTIWYSRQDNIWRIQFKNNVKLSYHYLIEIVKFMKKLK